MSKLAIPAILVATVMVAGMFAFAPVEQASTVHTTVGVLNVASAADVDTSAVTVVLATSATLKQGIICTTFTDPGADDNPNLEISLDATDTEVTDLITDLTGDNCETFVAHGLNLDALTTDATDDLDYALSWIANTP